MNRTCRLMLFYLISGIMVTPIALWVDKLLIDNYFADFLCMVIFAVETLIILLFVLVIPTFRVKAETYVILFIVFLLLLVSQIKSLLPPVLAIFWCFFLYSTVFVLQKDRGTLIFIKNRTTQLKLSNLLEACSHCGNPMWPEDVFCRNCQTLTPKVKKMLDAQPNKKPDQYVPGRKHRGLCCPHCDKLYLSSFIEKIHGRHIGTPIQYCKNCHNYFIDISNNEWVISKLSYKIERVFAPFLCFTNCLIVFELTENIFSLSVALIAEITYFLLHFPLCILLHNLTAKEHITASKERLEKNPDYLQILADMGYASAMSPEYQRFVGYQDKGLSWKNIIKEAFTFD